MSPTALLGRPLVEVKDIRHSYGKPGEGELLVLDDVNLSLRENEIVGLLGRSGSGKSTLLRSIAGLIRPSEGKVEFASGGEDGPTTLAMVSQPFALFPWLTLLENVDPGLEPQRVPAEERRRRALAAIDMI